MRTLETATNSMIESSGLMAGSFASAQPATTKTAPVSIVATFKRASFLMTYVFRPSSRPQIRSPTVHEATVKGAYERMHSHLPSRVATTTRSPIREVNIAIEISFITGDTIKGPMHTNDALAICGNPYFGRSPSDMIEVERFRTRFWFSTCNGSKLRLLQAPTLQVHLFYLHRRATRS